MTSQVYEIRNYTGKVLFSCKVPERIPAELIERYAVKLAVYSGVNLEDADLEDVNLEDVNLEDAYFRNANLIGASFKGAYFGKG